MSLRDLIHHKRNRAPELSALQRNYPWNLFPLELSRLFEDVRDFSLLGPEASEMSMLSPHVDVSETPTEIHVTAEIPGIKEEDLDISLTDNALILSGEKKIEKSEDGKEKNYHRVERAYGSFQRTIPLPAEVDRDKVEATYKDGVLHITLGKASEGVSRRKINVKKV